MNTESDTQRTARVIVTVLKRGSLPISRPFVEEVLGELVAPLAVARWYADNVLSDVCAAEDVKAAVRVGDRMYLAQRRFDLRTWTREKNRVYRAALKYRHEEATS